MPAREEGNRLMAVYYEPPSITPPPPYWDFFPSLLVRIPEHVGGEVLLTLKDFLIIHVILLHMKDIPDALQSSNLLS